jgi:hypothetical protein
MCARSIAIQYLEPIALVKQQTCVNSRPTSDTVCEGEARAAVAYSLTVLCTHIAFTPLKTAVDAAAALRKAYIIAATTMRMLITRTVQCRSSLFDLACCTVCACGQLLQIYAVPMRQQPITRFLAALICLALRLTTAFQHACTHCTAQQNKYNAVLLILLVGSFLIPMLQYWWYIRDEDADYE